MKKESDYEWLKLVNSQSLQGAIAHLDLAFQRHILRRLVAFQPFIRKAMVDHLVFLRMLLLKMIKYIFLNSKKRDICFIEHREEVVGEIRSATISKTSTGKYFISILVVKTEIEELSKNDNTLGIDLGIKDFAITSEEKIIENPKFLKKSLKKLKYLQRQLAKILFKSRKRVVRRLKVATCHERINSKRNDFFFISCLQD